MDISEKIKAAFTKDSNKIIVSFKEENFGKMYADAKDIYAALIEAGALEEATKFEVVVDDMLGEGACSNPEVGKDFIDFSIEFYGSTTEVGELVKKLI